MQPYRVPPVARAPDSEEVSAYIRKWLTESIPPHFGAAKWDGIDANKLSQKLIGDADGKLSELPIFGEQVFGFALRVFSTPRQQL